MCRSVSVECYSYCQKLSHSAGAQSEGSAPHSIPLFQSPTNLNHFYPVAERAAVAALPIPLDGIGRGAAGIRSTEYGYTKICTNKKQEIINPLLKVLEGS